MIDRRGDQLGKVLVCVHAVTIQHRGRATRSIDHDTHGHRLGQYKAQAGFEGSQEAGSLDEEVAIASTPSSVRLVSIPRIDWVDGIEVVLGLLRGVQIYEPNEVRIKTSRSGDHKRQKTDITRKQIVEVAMFCDLFARLLLNRAISVCESDTKGAVGDLHAATKTLMFEREVHD